MATLRKWTEGRALVSTLTRLNKIDDLLLEIAGLWGDVDQHIINQVDDLRARIAEARKDITESVAERADRQRAEALERAEQ